MPRNIFITGTDTDVGKTIVTAGLLRQLRVAGLNAASMKPVQTGAETTEDGSFVAPDLMVHHRAADFDPPSEDLDLMAPYLYEPACSPHLAGRMADRYPDIGHITDCAGKLAARYEILLVEGAGGIYAPLTESETMIDLMQALKYPILLVAHRGLGTINHTLLSIEALRGAGLEIMGVVFNEVEDIEPDFIKVDNPGAVESFGKVEILGNIDYLNDLESRPDAAWARFDECTPRLRRFASLSGGQ